MADRRGASNAPKIKGGNDNGKNRARTKNAPPPGGTSRWRAKRSDAGTKRHG